MRTYVIEKRKRYWIGKEENKGGGIVSSRKEEVVNGIRDQATLNRPSQVIFKSKDEVICKEMFEDVSLDKSASNDFLTD